MYFVICFCEIYFSPRDKEKFVAVLQSVNPAIEVQDSSQDS